MSRREAIGLAAWFALLLVLAFGGMMLTVAGGHG